MKSGRRPIITLPHPPAAVKDFGKKNMRIAFVSPNPCTFNAFRTQRIRTYFL